MHPDHDTAARLARTWAGLRDAQPGETKMLTGVEPATLAALLEGYAERERMREALRWIASGRGQCVQCGAMAEGEGGGVLPCGCRASWRLADPSALAAAALPSAREGDGA